MSEDLSSAEKGNILIVEDTVENLDVLTTLLTRHGYGVRVATDGPLALQAVQTRLPDLILLDIGIPGMSGYTVCERLKADTRSRDIPVIFLSALDAVADKVKGFAVGGVDYITKPFQVDEVLARVHTHLTLYLLQKVSEEHTRQLQQRNAALVHEIAERTRIEKMLRQTKAAAEAANLAKSTFLSNMSHELRTPLNAIIGFSQLMRRDPLFPDEHRSHLKIVGQSGDHLLNLINDVLEISKIEIGQPTLYMSSFDLYRMLDDLEELFLFRADRNNLTLNFHRDPGTPQYIQSDERKLRQILINLIGNAVKFTKQGAVTVRVKNAHVLLDDVQYVEREKSNGLFFEIEDSGPGIAPEELEHIFEAFTQTSSSYQSQKGTGLGLAISDKFVSLLGGKLSVSSHTGHGSIFYFEIPVQIADASEISLTEAPLRVAALETAQTEYKILVVDDRYENRTFLQTLLEEVGFPVRDAANGEQALEEYAQWQPDAILMDMRMPVMDGYEATRAIRRAEKLSASLAAEKQTSQSSIHKPQAIIRTPIIAVTSSAFEEERTGMLAAGCNAVLRKPFREAEVFELLQQYLGVRYIYEENADDGSDGSAPPPGTSLTPDDLATVSFELLEELYQATDRSNMDAIQQCIEAIREHEPSIAGALTTLAAKFDYDEILRVLHEAIQAKEA